MPYMPVITADDPKLTYNGYTFPQAGVETWMESENVFSDDGRVVIGTRHTIHAKGRLYEASNADGDALTIRTAIQEQGKALSYINQGNGGLVVNSTDATSQRDIEYGPKPQILKWTRVGYNFAWDFEWICSAVVSECFDGNYFGLVRYRKTTIRYSQDSNGWITRTYSGVLGIVTGPDDPGGTKITRFADDDAYKSLWFIEPVEGFKRTKAELSLSEDKSAVSFSYEDVEIPKGSYQKGVIDWEGSHQGKSGKGFVLSGVYTAQFTASYLMEPTLPNPALQAFNNFFAWVTSRQPATVKGLAWLFFTFGEDAKSGRLSFSLQYSFSTGIATLLQQSFLGKPVPNPGDRNGVTNWKSWAQSTPQINAPIHNAIGDTTTPGGTLQLENPPARAALAFRVTEDIIYDVCNPNQPAPAIPQAGDVVQSFSVEGGGNSVDDPAAPLDAWLMYKPTVRYSTDYGVAVHALAPKTDSGSLGNGGSGAPSLSQTWGADLNTSAGNPVSEDTSPAESAMTGTAQIPMGAGTDQDVVIQKRRGAVTYVILKLSALRYGYPVPVPQLKTAGGIPLTCLRSEFEPTATNLPGGLVLYGLNGIAIYVCTSSPGTPDPVLPPIPGLDGGGAGAAQGNLSGAGAIPAGQSAPL